MVKYTQTIRGQIAGELFECVWPFCGLALKGLSFPQVVTFWFWQNEHPVKVNLIAA